ncbi:ER-derived vesicles protein erv46 [Malassezia sp. CBS 17886]|nr:ER-derived vesicles protein erv46 [Malassezia sp. CBS 17886]
MGMLRGPLRGLDAFGRTSEDVRIRTNVGAFLTLMSGLLVVLLVVGEFFEYRRVRIDPRLEVDLSRGERLSVRLNVTFPRVPCYLLSMDVVDVVGEMQMDINHDILRTRLNRNGRPVEAGARDLEGEAQRIAKERGAGYCGSCYGASAPPNGCCNTCEDVRESYVRSNWSFGEPDDIEQCRAEHWSERIREQNHEGCNVAGEVRVNKVVGNFHLSPGRAFQRNSVHAHDLVPYLRGSGDEYHHFGHIINEFSFGSEAEFGPLRPARLRGTSLKEHLHITDALAGRRVHTEDSQFMFQYFIKVVPVEYHRLDGEVAKTYQYSATSYERDLLPRDETKGHDAPSQTSGSVMHTVEGVPGVFFNYEISPLRVVQTEHRAGFWLFFSNVCAIVGGVLTLAGLLDAFIYRSRRQFGAGGAYDDDDNGVYTGMDSKLL